MLAEVTDFELWQRAVRDQFREGESVGSLMLGIGCLVGFVLVVLVIARAQAALQQRREVEPESHPQRLYTHLLCTMGFTTAQRQLLEALGKASGLAHPTALLVSNVLFDRALTSWESKRSAKLADAQRLEDRKALTLMRGRLFPDGSGMVQSRNPGLSKARGQI